MTHTIIAYRIFAEQLMNEVTERINRSVHAWEIEQKAGGDWFSAFDLELENYIRQRISNTFPEHGFLGEEGGAFGNQSLMWVVDPIDGSMNFLRGVPHFSISLALVQAGEPIVACVCDPVRKELFSAAIGQGAHLNGRAIQVSKVAALSNAVAGTVFPKPAAADMDVYLRRLSKVLVTVAGARRMGSMALDLAYLGNLCTSTRIRV